MVWYNIIYGGLVVSISVCIAQCTCIQFTQSTRITSLQILLWNACSVYEHGDLQSVNYCSVSVNAVISL